MNRKAIHRSVWCGNESIERQYDSLTTTHTTEVLVIGAGITGLSTALELLQRGHRVTVCEAETIGSGTTGGSSGHADAHPERGPAWLIEKVGEAKAKKFVALRKEAIDKIEARAGDESAFVRVPAWHYTEQEKHCEKLRTEFDAARRLNLSVRWEDDVPLPHAHAGYRIEEMGRFDCYRYLRRLARLVTEAGGRIFEETLVAGPTEEAPTSLEAGKGKVCFDHVVTAVHANYNGSLALYAQTPPYQSYVMAVNVLDTIPDALFWDDSEPYHYIRLLEAAGDSTTLLVGGADHRTGAGSGTEAIEKLDKWVRSRFKVETVAKVWSAEFFEPTDGMPLVGRAPLQENVWLATGLSGVGLTLGTAAGQMLAAQISGEKTDCDEMFCPSRFDVGSIGELAKAQFATVANYAERVIPMDEVDPTELAAGDGAVGTINGCDVALCRDRLGKEHRHRPVCTHMGGRLHWNKAEQTWDCPVHGGRFAADGHRLYGPPESDLSPPEKSS